MTLMILVIVALGVGATFLFALSLIPQKSVLKKTLEELEARGVQRDSSGVKPFERVFSKEKRGALRRKLIEGGWYTVTPAQMGVRLVGGALFGAIFAVFIFTRAAFQSGARADRLRHC